MVVGRIHHRYPILFEAMADDANPEILELGILPYNTVIREK
jgi:hypothetical protein